MPAQLYRLVTLVLLLAWPLAVTAWAQKKYITDFGTRVLVRTALVARGRVLKVLPLQKMLWALRFRVDEVFLGNSEIGGTITVFQNSRPPLAVDAAVIAFLQRLSARHNYQLIGAIAVTEKEREVKVRTFRQILAIENAAPGPKRWQRYKTHVLDSLQSSNDWLRWHGLRELEYLVLTNASVLSSQELRDLSVLFLHSRNQRFKSILGEIIAIARRKIKATGSSGNSTPPQERQGLSTQNWEQQIVQERDRFLQHLLQVPARQQVNQMYRVLLYPGPPVEQALLQLLHSPNQHVRALAAYLLGLKGSPRAIPALRQCLRQDHYLRVRKNALQALGRLHAVSAQRQIARYLYLDYTRREACKALCLLGSPQATALLQQYLQQASAQARQQIQDLLPRESASKHPPLLSLSMAASSAAHPTNK